MSDSVAERRTLEVTCSRDDAFYLQCKENMGGRVCITWADVEEECRHGPLRVLSFTYGAYRTVRIKLEDVS